MIIKTKKITINSSDAVPELIDITGQVKQVIEDSDIKEGQVLVFAAHTTAAVILQEPESGLLNDLKNLICNLSKKEKDYYHTAAPDHQKDRMPNGHSHCQHLLLGSSEVVPIENGHLLLGTFQCIFLVELDRARTRTIIVQVMGETR